MSPYTVTAWLRIAGFLVLGLAICGACSIVADIFA